MSFRLAAVAIVLALIALAARPAAAADDWANFAFNPHPGAQLPLNTRLFDEQGRPVTLGSYFSGKPVVLVLEYLRCRTLCGITLDNVMGALGRMPLEPGRDFQFVALSIDPRDGPAAALIARAKYLSELARRSGGRGIHFLTGPAKASRRIADTIGFPYRYDPALDQFVHPAGFVTASPDGRVARYILGVGVTPAQLTAALAAAARDQAAGPLTQLFLLCHIQGVRIGRYTGPVLAAFTLANIAAGLTLAAVFVAIRRRNS